MELYFKRAEKILARIDELASISEDTRCITRTFGTDAFITGSGKVKAWMAEAGLETRVDNIGNVRGKLWCTNPAARTFVIASHIDTVVNAGKFDGPLGVLIGLDLLEQLILQRKALPFHIELIAFSDEEGVRFHTTYLGSRVVAGSFDHRLLQKKDASGITLKEVIVKMDKDPSKLDQDAILPQEWLGYFEIHIEQGPVLYKCGVPVAVVTAIAGQYRIEVRFKGVSGHAGTVPMDMRKDALCCAAEFILEVEKFALAHKDKIVATVGKLEMIHAASNVIPGAVVCSVDLRSADEVILASFYKSIQEICTAVCNRRAIVYEWILVQKSRPVACDSVLGTILSKAIEKCSFEVIRLVSGAGHDAVPVSEVSPVCMLFICCFEGVSHNPMENVALEEIAAGIQVAEQFILNLIQHNQQ
jgi:allantoate deiminase